MTHFGPHFGGPEEVFEVGDLMTDAAGRLGQMRPVQAFNTTPRERGVRDEDRLYYNVSDPIFGPPNGSKLGPRNLKSEDLRS